MKRFAAGLGILILLFSVYNSFNPVTTFRTVNSSGNPGIERDYADKGKNKSDSPQEYARYFQEITTMAGKTQTGYKLGYRLEEFRKSKSRLASLRTGGLDAIEWIERGPGNVPGRTRGLIIHPDDPTGRTWIAGSAGGGIWKTIDGGLTWSNKTPDLPNLSTATLALSPANPAIIYAGTGEGFFNSGSIRGDGIFKSTDGGETWNQLASTAGNVNFQNINRIIVNPDNPDVLLVCSNGFPPFTSGILKSTDGGGTWENVFRASTRVQQIIAHPTDFNILFATLNGQGIIKSTDQGDSWSGTGIGLAASGRIELAISPSNPQRMYAAAESSLSNVKSDLFISDDGGENWNVMGQENVGPNPAWLGDQGWYDNAITVHPFDQDIVYVGGVDLFKAEMKPGTRTKSARVIGVSEVNTQSFMDWINAGLSYLRGGLATGVEWYEDNDGFPKDFENSDFRAVEIRFGPGKKQMAHRFIVPFNSGMNNDGGPGVVPEDHLYQDYVEVPFEVWDTDENRQLMVSFRDQERDGTWNLIHRDPNDQVPGRDYIFVQAITYDPDAPDPNVRVKGGQAYKTMYSMWPTLAEGAVWDEENLPDSKIVILYGQLIERLMSPIQLTNSGGSFSSGVTTVHPDFHNIQVFSTANGTFKFIVATDGGIYYSDEEVAPGQDNTDWHHANFGYNTTQFYGVDKAPGESKYVGGTQDNGTWISLINDANATTQYTQKIGGDGFDTFWSYANPDLVIGSAQLNFFRRSIDGGFTWSTATSGLDDKGEDKAPFISVIAGHKLKGKTLFTVGESGVWKSIDFGASWFLIPINSSWISSGGISSSQSVVFSKANPSIIWAGGGMTSQRSMHVSANGGTSFVKVPNIADTLGSISGFATHPLDEKTAYVLFSFANFAKIFRTTDLGQTWEDISGFNGGKSSTTGFPDVAVYSLLVLPHQPQTIWAGTEIGVFESIDNGATWHILEGNFPATAVWELKAVDDQVIAATHGRGIWTVTLPGLKWPIDVVSGVEDEELSRNITVYPNPVDKNLHINYEFSQPGPATLQIIQSDGKILLHKEYARLSLKGDIILDTSNLPDGILILTLQKGGQSFSSRLMVRH